MRERGRAAPQGTRRAMLIPKVTLKAEGESEAPLRHALGLKPTAKLTRKNPPAD
jgi:hypothetical protein